MRQLETTQITVNSRYQQQNASIAISDVYDALVETITNVDDRYQLLDTKEGQIEVEVERHHKEPSVIRTRDFADGMTSADMKLKLGQRGSRISGLEAGAQVRGTNSRGAKDISVLGQVTFDSIAADGRHHRAVIRGADFTQFESEDVTDILREELGIPKGTGTVVTIEVGTKNKVSRHRNFAQKLRTLIPIRHVLDNPKRVVVLRDCLKKSDTLIQTPKREGKKRVSQTLDIPGYPAASAKLEIWRSPKQLNNDRGKCRAGGIVIRSTHAAHEATLFDSEFDNDPHAAWFYGKLRCEYIDQLWNEYDDDIEQGKTLSKKNPYPIYSPLRQGGLTKTHPFVQALFGEARKYLRPLVAEERERSESERVNLESSQTRKLLNKLGSWGADFMEEKHHFDEPTRDPNAPVSKKKIRDQGFILAPPFVQLVVGESCQMYLNVLQEAYPEFTVGQPVEIEALTDEISLSRRICSLEKHPTTPNVLRALWSIKAKSASLATGIYVHCGPIQKETMIEIFKSESEKYREVDRLMFSKKTARVTVGTKRNLHLRAPLSLIPKKTEINIDCPPFFKVGGQTELVPSKKKGIAECRLTVTTTKDEVSGTLTAQTGGREASIELNSAPKPGSGISIKLDTFNFGGTQRYVWLGNVIQIDAVHPSLSRYLGRKSDDFPGQEKNHFKILLAEIVADAMCSKIIERRELDQEYRSADRDWSFFYSQFSSLMTDALPEAHSIVLPDSMI